ncbi:nucleotidyl transferase AbiEii/AbiGii toxin family protein [Pseudoflavitalea sp. X16]|uniref:nucleotidyl transferase AbiEii/AbiGii toxin family protein n=1 Tax=Paraflavitalea devenefica TaxID=2716334 RepID=UPI001423085E|nr:nucleotidyl transferase AbiEii/AbiGii toxin family protein [Paraflavitalea devenefica]NII26501.1 nucleotidyl transferase AbiEii/AbiGii toxin family protein [Paraflavitalea devenefica]
MAADFLHNHPEFEDLLLILESQTGILANLIEKDYWIMHVLHGLKRQGYEFELKGGTSLSKGFRIIERFSEDIDIHIKPSAHFSINENPNNNKEKNVAARKAFYDWLVTDIKIDGIVSVQRDHVYDDPNFRSGGIRLLYDSKTSILQGVKEGILLEVGFDTVTPNQSVAISSWAFDRAQETSGLEIIDNRAADTICYNPEYTLVEKLQTIATKFRREQETGVESKNYMRQYYDVYSLLGNERVQSFIGTEEYKAHKEKRFPAIDFNIPIAGNEAFLLSEPALRKRFDDRYKATAALYYNGQPDFAVILERIEEYLDRL